MLEPQVVLLLAPCRGEPSPCVSSPVAPIRRTEWTPLVALAVENSAARAQVVAELLSKQCPAMCSDLGCSRSEKASEKRPCEAVSACKASRNPFILYKSFMNYVSVLFAR